MSIINRPRAVKSTALNPAKGFSLIEVLVALLILSIGLLSLAGVQVRGVSSNYSALQRSQAILCAYDIVERMRANRDTACQASFPYQIGLEDEPVGGTELVQKDLTGWRGNVGNLPEGKGAIAMSDLGNDRILVTVLVQWNERKEIQQISVETIL